MTKNPNKIKAHFWNFDDFLLSFSILFGTIFVAILCYFTPVKDFTIKPLAKLINGNTSSEKNKKTKGFAKAAIHTENFWSGIYSLGNVVMNLGRKNEYLDSAIDIEYNGQMLTISTSGDVRDEKSANYYFKKQEAKLKDAIVMQSSVFDGNQINNSFGIDEFKSDLVNSLNRHFHDESVITNIYFRRFVLFSDQLTD